MEETKTTPQGHINKEELTDRRYALRMRTIYPCRLNKGFGSKFPEGYQVQLTP